MRIVGQITLQNAARKNADASNALAVWRTSVMVAAWASFAEVKADFPTADYVRPFTVFNVKGNRYRLIALIDYAEKVAVITDFLTHATYNKGKWK